MLRLPIVPRLRLLLRLLPCLRRSPPHLLRLAPPCRLPPRRLLRRLPLPLVLPLVLPPQLLFGLLLDPPPALLRLSPLLHPLCPLPLLVRLLLRGLARPPLLRLPLPCGLGLPLRLLHLLHLQRLGLRLGLSLPPPLLSPLLLRRRRAEALLRHPGLARLRQLARPLRRLRLAPRLLLPLSLGLGLLVPALLLLLAQPLVRRRLRRRLRRLNLPRIRRPLGLGCLHEGPLQRCGLGPLRRSQRLGGLLSGLALLPQVGPEPFDRSLQRPRAHRRFTQLRVRKVERRAPVERLELGICAACQQDLHHPRVVPRAREHQRRLPRVVPRVDARAAIEQKVHHLCVVGSQLVREWLAHVLMSHLCSSVPGTAFASSRPRELPVVRSRQRSEVQQRRAMCWDSNAPWAARVGAAVVEDEVLHALGRRFRRRQRCTARIRRAAALQPRPHHSPVPLHCSCEDVLRQFVTLVVLIVLRFLLLLLLLALLLTLLVVLVAVLAVDIYVRATNRWPCLVVSFFLVVEVVPLRVIHHATHRGGFSAEWESRRPSLHPVLTA